MFRSFCPWFLSWKGVNIEIFSLFVFITQSSRMTFPFTFWNLARCFNLRSAKMTITSGASIFTNSFLATFTWFKMFSSAFYDLLSNFFMFNVVTRLAKPFDVQRFAIIMMMAFQICLISTSLTVFRFFDRSNVNIVTKFHSCSFFLTDCWRITLFAALKSFFRSFSLIAKGSVNQFATINTVKIVS